MNMKVRILVGAQQAYACITLPGKSMDVALSGGHSPSFSLDESAKDLRIKAQQYLDRAKIMEAAASILKKDKSGGEGVIQSSIHNSNEWHLSNKVEEYVDFEKELIDFDDDGNTSIDMRLSFDIEGHNAYIVIVRHNDDGNTRELDPQINVEWDEALRMIGELASHVLQ